MPPKELSKEQEMKLQKKDRDEKLAQLKKWNADEFARLERVKKIYCDHWMDMVKYVTKTEQQEKKRLEKESLEFANLLNEISGRYQAELDQIQCQIEWDDFLHTVEPKDDPGRLITALDALIAAIKPDSSVKSLRLQLSEDPILRPLLEDKRNLYEVLTAACARLGDVLQKLEQYIRFDMPYHNRLSQLKPRVEDLTLTQNRLGHVISLNELDAKEMKAEDMFVQKTAFEARDSTTELYEKTLKNQFYAPGPVPKPLEIPELEPPKKDDKKKPAAEATAAVVEDKKAVAAVVQVQQDPSEEILSFVAYTELRMTHPDLFQGVMNKQVEQFNDEFNALLLKETAPFKPEEDAGSAPVLQTDKSKRDLKVQDQIKQIIAAKAWVDQVRTSQYVSREELIELKGVAIIQQQRILLRAYLFDFQERAIRYVIDHPEAFQDQHEIVKMVAPAVDTVNDEQQEQQNDQNNEEAEEHSEEETAPKVTGGLSKGMLSQLDPTKMGNSLAQSQKQMSLIKLQEMQTDAVQNENRLKMSGTLELVQETKASMFEKLTYRPHQIYNENNITSVNEKVFKENYKQLYPALRLQAKMNYVIDRPEGWFMLRRDAQILPQLCRTWKQYFSGSSQQLGLFYARYNSKLEYKGKVDPEKFELSKYFYQPHELNYLQNIWVNSKVATSSKVSFSNALKVILPHALLQQPIGFLVNQFKANVVGSHHAEGFDDVMFRNVPTNLDLARFYPTTDYIKTGRQNNVVNLLQTLVIYRYLNPTLGIPATDAEVKPYEANEHIESFLKFDHVNMALLGVMFKKMKDYYVSQQKKIVDIVQQFAVLSIHSVDKTTLLNDFVRTIVSIQFTGEELTKLEFKIVQEYYRVMREAQRMAIDAEKKKKIQLQKKADMLRENQGLLDQIVKEMDERTVRAAVKYFDSLYAELDVIQDEVRKPKQRVVIPRTLAVLESKKTQPKDEDEEDDLPKIPELTTVGYQFQTDFIQNTIRPNDGAKWLIGENWTENLGRTAQNHQAYHYDDEQVDKMDETENAYKVEVKSYENKPLDAKESKLVGQPVKYQIFKLKELQKQKQGANLGKNGPDTLRLNFSIGQRRATVVFPSTLVAEVRNFKIFSLAKKFQQLTCFYENQYFDKHLELTEVQEPVSLIDTASSQHVLPKQYQMVEHVKYPRTSQYFTVYPQMPMLRFSEVVAERAKMGAMDACLLYNYVPNVFDYHQSLLTKDTDDDGKKASTVPIGYEIQLSPELRQTVKSVSTIGEAHNFLTKAHYYGDYADLIGRFFIAMWNVATGNFDVDGVEKVEFKKDTGTIICQLTKPGTFALCCLRQNCVPFRGWALVPDSSRGEGYKLADVLDEYQKHVNDLSLDQKMSNQFTQSQKGFENSMAKSLGRSQGGNADATNRTRYTFFHPAKALARTGRLDDVPLVLQPTDVQIPYFVKRALSLAKQNVGVHSVLLKLVLPQNIQITIRILPEGYEVAEFKDYIIETSDRINEMREAFEKLRVEHAGALQKLGQQLKDQYARENPSKTPEELEDYDPTSDESFEQKVSEFNKTEQESSLALSKEAQLAYTNYASFQAQVKMEPQADSLPKIFKNVVFLSVEDLVVALRQAGIVLELDDEYIKRAKIEPKGLQIEAELARQLAVIATTSRNGQPVVTALTHSPWNRQLPQVIASYPSENQFQITQDAFDNSAFMARGYIPAEQLKQYVENELKRRKGEEIAIVKYMKDKNVDEKTARKAVVVKNEEKIEKGAPSRLGPAPYGLTSELVDMRAVSVTDLEQFMHAYLSAVDRLREVQHRDSAAFVVIGKPKISTESAAAQPADEHKKRLSTLEIPVMKTEKPTVPPDPFAPKKKNKQEEQQQIKKERKVVDESGLRCSQTKPYGQQDIEDTYTISVNKSGGAYLARVASVPVGGPGPKEEFCNMPLPGTESHAGAIALFADGETQQDAVLTIKVFELLNALRLGTLG